MARSPSAQRPQATVGGVPLTFLNPPFNLRGSKDIAATSPLGFNSALPGFQAQFGLKIAF